MLINEGGKFKAAEDSIAPGLREIGLVNSAVWADYNNDGWHDLVIALDWGAVTILKTQKASSQRHEFIGLDKSLGWWHGIAAADLDDDGDLDFVVTIKEIIQSTIRMPNIPIALLP